MFHWSNCLSWSRHTPKEPRVCITYNERHPRTPTTEKQERTEIVLRIVQRIQKLHFKLRGYSCTFKLKALQRPTMNLVNTHRRGNELLEYATDVHISYLVLTFLNPTGHRTLATDACDVQVRCAFLHQQLDKTTKTIGHWSNYETDAEQKYDLIKRDCIAVLW